MAEEKKIATGNYKWHYERSRVLGSNESYPDRVESMDAKCVCGSRWNARRGRELEHGNFIETLGGFTIKCPHCGAEEQLTNPPAPE